MVAVDFSAPTFAIGKVSAEGHAGKFRINATIMSVKETPSNRQMAQCQSAMKVYGTKQTEANALIFCCHPNQAGRVRYTFYSLGVPKCRGCSCVTVQAAKADTCTASRSGADAAVHKNVNGRLRVRSIMTRSVLAYHA